MKWKCSDDSNTGPGHLFASLVFTLFCCFEFITLTDSVQLRPSRFLSWIYKAYSFCSRVTARHTLQCHLQNTSGHISSLYAMVERCWFKVWRTAISSNFCQGGLADTPCQAVARSSAPLKGGGGPPNWIVNNSVINAQFAVTWHRGRRCTTSALSLHLTLFCTKSFKTHIMWVKFPHITHWMETMAAISWPLFGDSAPWNKS